MIFEFSCTMSHGTEVWTYTVLMVFPQLEKIFIGKQIYRKSFFVSRDINLKRGKSIQTLYSNYYIQAM